MPGLLFFALFAATALLAIATLAIEIRRGWKSFAAIGGAIDRREYNQMVSFAIRATSPLSGWAPQPTGRVIYSAHFTAKSAARPGELLEAA